MRQKPTSAAAHSSWLKSSEASIQIYFSGQRMDQPKAPSEEQSMKHQSAEGKWSPGRMHLKLLENL